MLALFDYYCNYFIDFTFVIRFGNIFGKTKNCTENEAIEYTERRKFFNDNAARMFRTFYVRTKRSEQKILMLEFSRVQRFSDSSCSLISNFH